MRMYEFVAVGGRGQEVFPLDLYATLVFGVVQRKTSDSHRIELTYLQRVIHILR